MEKKYALCLEVLRRIEKAGILNEIMVIGSWCIYFLQFKFRKKLMDLVHSHQLSRFFSFEIVDELYGFSTFYKFMESE